MNWQKRMTKEGARHLLQEWGHYLRVNRFENLGYPSENTISRIMREGIGASQSTVPIVGSVPEYFETVNGIVLKMERPIHTAIYCRFVFRMTDKKGAAACECSRSEFRNRIDNGILFTSGALSYA